MASVITRLGCLARAAVGAMVPAAIESATNQLGKEVVVLQQAGKVTYRLIPRDLPPAPPVSWREKFTNHTLYHGSVASRLGDQLNTRLITNIGRRIWGDNLPSATAYALRRGTPTLLDEGGAIISRGDALVVRLESAGRPIPNKIEVEGHGFCGLGMFDAFDPSAAPVRIAEAYDVCAVKKE